MAYTNSYDLVCIGGGAAGMLASGTAASAGIRVLVAERNDKQGKKLLITGKGRCNITNNGTVGEALENIPNGARFLQSAMHGFPPDAVMAFFESLGVRLKTERGGRVFPMSDRSADIVSALQRYMDNAGVVVKRARIREVMIENGKVTGVRSDDGIIDCKAVILATGGLSYPGTGSDGDGHEIARSLGYTVTPLRGSLVPLTAEPELCSGMQGLTLKNVRLSVYESGAGEKKIFDEQGELLFTHFGLSGPLVLSASAHMRGFDNKKYHVQIDLKPALDEKKLDLRVLRDFKKYSNRDYSNSLGDLVNRSMIPAVIKRSGIPPATKVHSISREQRTALVRLLKAFRIDIDGLRPVEEAIITSGGISLNEINPKTMESKLVRGLFFAGEIIDADAYTGGYNLQIAWSTAFAAAFAAIKAVDHGVAKYI